MTTKEIRVSICDQDGVVLDIVTIDLAEVATALQKDGRAIMQASHEATEAVRDEITAALKRNVSYPRPDSLWTEREGKKRTADVEHVGEYVTFIYVSANRKPRPHHPWPRRAPIQKMLLAEFLRRFAPAVSAP